MPLKELTNKLDELVEIGVMQGRLEIIALVGLNSPLIFPLLQSYVDRTADVQTAAYISAYAINVQQVSGLEPQRQNNRLGKFIRAYRDFLNQMQMWSARAVFDQKMGAIVRSVSAGEGSQNEQSKLLIARNGGVDDSHEVTPTIGK